jgi:hypothetical protein
VLNSYRYFSHHSRYYHYTINPRITNQNACDAVMK